MQLHAYETDDGDFVLELDVEGIDYLTQGLEALRDVSPGAEKFSDSLVSNGGTPVGVGSFILRRA